ncbi:hypothetical protein J2T57_001700 [Natronocella acetinitrilica]|uniref:Uncharacterized protein n=1 Tax=Natronocella acetinitrilica TaxID=414046 RepID=A0AAE3KC71_9GAMM|nr:hypothetical protein [Natronocella acetinitrilica]MCP1674598.1 hypothetical protein [Natronocella acetinitrilica]
MAHGENPRFARLLADASRSANGLFPLGTPERFRRDIARLSALIALHHHALGHQARWQATRGGLRGHTLGELGVVRGGCGSLSARGDLAIHLHSLTLCPGGRLGAVRSVLPLRDDALDDPRALADHIERLYALAPEEAHAAHRAAALCGAPPRLAEADHTTDAWFEAAIADPERLARVREAPGITLPLPAASLPDPGVAHESSITDPGRLRVLGMRGARIDPLAGPHGAPPFRQFAFHALREARCERQAPGRAARLAWLMASLDSEALASMTASGCTERLLYDYLCPDDARLARYRRQAVAAFPALPWAILLAEREESVPQEILGAIDAGASREAALAAALRVSSRTVRALCAGARAPHFMAGVRGGVSHAGNQLRLLDATPLEFWPRDPEEHETLLAIGTVLGESFHFWEGAATRFEPSGLIDRPLAALKATLAERHATTIRALAERLREDYRQIMEALAQRLLRALPGRGPALRRALRFEGQSLVTLARAAERLERRLALAQREALDGWACAQRGGTPASWHWGALLEPSERHLRVGGCTLRIREITDPLALAAEGVTMGHCIAIRAEQCYRGGLRVWEITDVTGVRSTAAIAVSATGEGVLLSIQEHRGRGNAPAPREHRAAAVYLCRQLIERSCDAGVLARLRACARPTVAPAGLPDLAIEGLLEALGEMKCLAHFRGAMPPAMKPLADAALASMKAARHAA